MTVDPLVNEGLEEELLSSMMEGAKVRSLGREHFTKPIRSQMYDLLRDGVPYPQLVTKLRELGLREEDLYYVGDVYGCPTIPAGERMREAVAELKRLHRMRQVCHAADSWRKRAPSLTVDRAIVELERLLVLLKLDR